MMQILCYSDYKPSHYTTVEAVMKLNPDIICTLGDLERDDIRFLEGIHTIPKYGVYGNHCSQMYMDTLGIINVHNRYEVYNGIRIGGFGGCVRYKKSLYSLQYTQEEASFLLSQMPAVDIFIAHCPPYGINDDMTDTAHTGYKGLLDYINKHHPQLLLHGHTYPTAPQTHYNTTQIRYIYGDMVVDYSIYNS